MDNKGFVSNRRKYATHCPCGKDNKDGKFAPFKGQEPDGTAKYGQCHSCGETFFPPEEKDDGLSGTSVQKYIPPEVMEKSMSVKIDHDVFFKFLSNMFGKDRARKAMLTNNVGTSKDGTVFWMIDAFGRVCQPKVMKYKEDGHRTGYPKVPQQYKGDNGYYPCAFNTVNATTDEEAVVVFVESEKTAVLCSVVFPEVKWVSGGGASGMSYDKAHPFRERECLILYDADEAGRDNSGKLKDLLRKDRCRVKVCDPFEDRTDGYDIGDYVVDHHDNEDKLNKMRSYLTNAIKSLKGEDKSDYDAGVYRVKPQMEYLLHTFRHGKKRGETTHMIELDKNFKWKKTFLYTITGYPNSGKSEALLFLACLKVLNEGWRVLMYVPESMSSHEGIMTIDEVVDTLAHIIKGQSTDPENSGQMSEEEYIDALELIDKHFVFLYPPDGKTKPSQLLEYAQYVIDESEEDEKFDMLIVDPWNNMMSDQRSNEMIDDYIMRELIGIKHFLVINDMVGCLVVHPKSPPVNKDGTVPPANAFTLRGGAAFNNKSDGILSVHRPDWFKESVEIEVSGETRQVSGRNSPRVELHTFKMKNQKLVQVVLGFSEWRFNRKTNRYENKYGHSPFDEAYKKYHSSKPEPKQRESYGQSNMDFPEPDDPEDNDDLEDDLPF